MTSRILLGVAILLYCHLSSSLTRADEYVAVDPSDFNVWDMEEQDPEVEARKLFNLLCEQYDLTHKNERIDCAHVEFRSKDLLLDDDNHLIQKREVEDESELEGSGEDKVERPLEHELRVAANEEGSNAEAPRVNEQAPNENSTTLVPVLYNPLSIEAKSAKEEAEPSAAETEPKKQDTVDMIVESIPLETAGSDNQAEHNPEPKEEEAAAAEANNQDAVETSHALPEPIPLENAGSDNKAEANPKPKEDKAAAAEANNQDAIETHDTVPPPIPLENAGSDNQAEANPKPKEDEAAAAEANNQDAVETHDTVPPPIPLEKAGSDNQAEANPKPKEDEAAAAEADNKENAESGNQSEAKPEVVVTENVNVTLSGPVEVAPINPVATTVVPQQPKEVADVAANVGSDKDSSVAATTKAETETTLKPKEVEPVEEQQSGNAVLLKNPKVIVPVGVEGSDGDKHLTGLSTNANIQTNQVEPNTGESAKNVTKAGKDTTILVTLFVVVLVIGAAAFTHNFIKKRKQRASENIQNDVVNGIRRSLQNLTSGNGKSNGTDIEQGTEMKPLIKNNSPTMVKEYSDTKKSAEA